MATVHTVSLALTSSTRAPSLHNKSATCSRATSASTTMPPPPAPSNMSLTAQNQASSAVSNLALFLRNLRLLDLDRHPDWPDITAPTFAPAGRAGSADAGLKRRVQCVEWALYQLFVLWDADEARNKLRPFFPPLDQVQSLNLRAALLRCLEQAKKNGVLGRDVVVRKTMLDECKGDRLEEVLAMLSSAVLKRAVAEGTLDGGGVRHPALAQTWALENRGYKGERTQLAVLALAHRASLKRLLKEKEAARAQFRDFAGLLDQKDRSIARRREQIKAAEQAARQTKNKRTVTEDEKREIRRIVRNHWSGNERWLETLLYGDSTSRMDDVLSAPFDSVWRRVQSNRLAELEDRSGGMLQQLEDRVHVQKQRLEKWHGFREKIMGGAHAEPGEGAGSRQPSGHQRGIDLGFSAHECLHLGRLSPRTISTRANTLDGDYEELVKGLQAALDQTSRSCHQPLGGLLRHHRADAVKEGPCLTVPDGEGGNVSELSEVEEDPAPSYTRNSRQELKALVSQGHDQHQRESIEAAPILQQPQEPRPLRASQSVATRRTALSTNASATEPTIEGPWPANAKGPGRRSSPSPPTSPRQRSASPAKPAVPSPERVVSPTQQMAEQILATMSATSPSPAKPSRHVLSLAERTRMSMFRRTSRARPRPNEHGDDDDDDEPDFDPLPLRKAPTVTVDRAAVDQDVEGDEQEEDLLARTRRSMAGFEAARQKAQLDRRRSQRKARQPSGVGTAGSEASTNHHFPTLEEQEEGNSMILAEELMNGTQDDYNAVFMSRPKIKTSPAGTPGRIIRREDC